MKCKDIRVALGYLQSDYIILVIIIIVHKQCSRMCLYSSIEQGSRVVVVVVVVPKALSRKWHTVLSWLRQNEGGGSGMPGRVHRV